MRFAIRNARLRGGKEPVAIAIENGVIAAVGAGPAPSAQDFDAEGRLVLPAFVDPHIHLDKTLLGEQMRQRKEELAGGWLERLQKLFR